MSPVVLADRQPLLLLCFDDCLARSDLEHEIHLGQHTLLEAGCQSHHCHFLA